jgi:hypothetical protein
MTQTVSPAVGGPRKGFPLAHWFLEQEARALINRLDRVRPFALQETMVPAAALMPAAQFGIEQYLIEGRRELRQRIERYLAWLRGPGQTASTEEIQRRFTFLRLRFNVALSHLDLFAEAIGQRSEHEVGVWLSGLDVAAQDALTLPGRYYDPPPIICYLHRGMGGAIRRARTRLPGGGQTPVAVIRIPRERMIGFGIASSLVHEVGHQGAALLSLVESLRPALQQAQRRAEPAHREAWKLWERWISEIVADFWAVAKVGISSTLGLIGIVSLPRWFVFRMSADDPHPFPWIRVMLSCGVGDHLYPHRQWKDLAGLWQQFYPTATLDPERRRTLGALMATMPAFISLLTNHRPASLAGKSLGQVVTLPDRAPQRLLEVFQTWRNRPTLMKTVPPTLAFAVFGRARAAGRLTPEEEDRLLGGMITHWALQSTLEMAQACATKAPPVTRRAEGGSFTAARTALSL